MSRYAAFVLCSLLTSGCSGPADQRSRTSERDLSAPVERAVGEIELDASYEPLVTGFRWARTQALAYAFEGDPVGPWYEAALPGREAFCMRDVSHQATGALALGLWKHTKNMLHKFALGIAESRDWCSYWEINRYDQPAPVDYRSDEDFWYNLPANFDVVETAYRAYEWTGDKDYLTDLDFDEFYRRSLTSYVAAWDPDGDGLMESPEENGYRGIPTYWEGGGPRALTGGDLIATQYAANQAYARILASRGEEHEARRFLASADRLRGAYNDDWWNPDLGRFYSSIISDGSYDTTHIPLLQILPLYYGIVEPGPRRERLLDNLAEGEIVEVNVYLAEANYRNGRDAVAFRYLMRQMDPELDRREYPENPFTAIGTTVRYLMGVDPTASQSLVETRSRLPPQVPWVRLEHIPVLRNVIAVQHNGLTESRLQNRSGKAIRWRAVFPGAYEVLEVDGRTSVAQVRHTDRGDPETFLVTQVDAGKQVTVRVETH